MKSVAFFINKQTDKLKSYRVFEKSPEEMKEAIDKYNANDSYPDKCVLITDQHVIDAIIQRESFESMKGHLDDFKDGLKEVQNTLDYMQSIIEHTEEYITGKERE